MMMGMTLSRSVDIHECATYAIGAVEVKTGAILHEQGIQYENKFIFHIVFVIHGGLHLF